MSVLLAGLSSDFFGPNSLSVTSAAAVSSCQWGKLVVVGLNEPDITGPAKD